ncbi:hypothetical protein ACOSQ4_019983 [Xanthoceras sorbifolium]
MANIGYRMPDWNIDSVSKKSVYPKGIFYFKNKYYIQTTSGSISSNNEQVSIQLLDPHIIARHKQKYRYIHVGLVQVHVTPYGPRGINGSISLFLRDKRLLDFSDSLLNVPESSKANDPLNFFPNFMVSLQEIDILHHLSLRVKFQDLQMVENCIPLGLVYRVYYKWMRDQNPVAKTYGPGIEIIFSQTNMRSPNDLTPRIIKRSDIQLPEGWNFQDENPEEQKHNSPRFIQVSGCTVQLELPRRKF